MRWWLMVLKWMKYNKIKYGMESWGHEEQYIQLGPWLILEHDISIPQKTQLIVDLSIRVWQIYASWMFEVDEMD